MASDSRAADWLGLTTSQEQLARAIDQILSQSDSPRYELVHLETLPEPEATLRVSIAHASPSEEGVSLQDCVRVNEILDPVLEEVPLKILLDELFPKSYSLEVSSPGDPRPLQRIRAFEYEKGAWVELTLQEPPAVEDCIKDLSYVETFASEFPTPSTPYQDPTKKYSSRKKFVARVLETSSAALTVEVSNRRDLLQAQLARLKKGQKHGKAASNLQDPQKLQWIIFSFPWSKVRGGRLIESAPHPSDSFDSKLVLKSTNSNRRIL
jgi:ribosome maturation factor RimP